MRDVVVYTVPARKRFEIKFLGINGFGHPNQPLFYAVQVTTKSLRGIYPIAPAGMAEIADPEFPMRYFRSQETMLHADQKSDLIFTVARKDTTGNVRVFINLCGLLVDVSGGDTSISLNRIFNKELFAATKRSCSYESFSRPLIHFAARLWLWGAGGRPRSCSQRSNSAMVSRSRLHTS